MPDVVALTVEDYGQTPGTPETVGSAFGSENGFDIQRTGPVHYVACAGKLRKASAIDGSFSDFVAFSGANPVCAIVPYFRRGSNTSRNTDVSDPDVLVGLDGNDSDGHNLYWIDGDGTKHAIDAHASMEFTKANAITTHYGTRIAVFGLVSGAYKLYVTTTTGSSWTFVSNLTTPRWIRGRRNDSVLANAQLYVCHNNAIYYSSKWGAGSIFSRLMPITDIQGFDTVW